MTQEEFIKYLVDILIYPDHFEINKWDIHNFYKNDKCYFQYNSKNDTLWCSYKHVWNIFEKEYGLNDKKIEDLLKDMLIGGFNMCETILILSYNY